MCFLKYNMFHTTIMLDDTMDLADTKKVQSILNRSFKYLSISSTFSDEWQHQSLDFSVARRLKQEYHSELVYLSMVIMNNSYEYIKSQKTDNQLGVVSIYDKVFRDLRKNNPFSIKEYMNYNKENVIELTDDERYRLKNFKHHLVNNKEALSLMLSKDNVKIPFFYDLEKDYSKVVQELSVDEEQKKLLYNIIDEVVNPRPGDVLFKETIDLYDRLKTLAPNIETNFKQHSNVVKYYQYELEFYERISEYISKKDFKDLTFADLYRRNKKNSKFIVDIEKMKKY